MQEKMLLPNGYEFEVKKQFHLVLDLEKKGKFIRCGECLTPFFDAGSFYHVNRGGRSGFYNLCNGCYDRDNSLVGEYR